MKIKLNDISEQKPKLSDVVYCVMNVKVFIIQTLTHSVIHKCKLCRKCCIELVSLLGKIYVCLCDHPSPSPTF